MSRDTARALNNPSNQDANKEWWTVASRIKYIILISLFKYFVVLLIKCGEEYGETHFVNVT